MVFSFGTYPTRSLTLSRTRKHQDKTCTMAILRVIVIAAAVVASFADPGEGQKTDAPAAKKEAADSIA